MSKKDDRNILKNSTMLFFMNVAKMVFPLLTLPYLTRVLTKDCYGTVVYVKSVMSYMQLIVDFGFLLSATKGIVNAAGDKEECGRIIGNVIFSKIMLFLAAFMVLIVLVCNLPILYAHPVYTVLSMIPVFLTIFLLDFLFRGLEKMEIITLRFVLMRGISTVLTFVVVHSDADLVKMPFLDIAGTLAAVMLVWMELRKLDFHVHHSGIKDIWMELKSSAVYFVSSVASTSLSALNTLILGVALTTTEVAYWGVCTQAVAAVQAVYSPITDSLYPVMIKRRDLNMIKRMVRIVAPFLVVGCIAAYYLAEFGLTLIGGTGYSIAAPVFRRLIPVLFFSFFSLLLGWPSLGAIDKNLQTSKTTIYSVVFQIAGLIVLFLTDNFTLFSVAVLRSLTEIVLCSLRFSYVVKYRKEFNNGKKGKQYA